MNGIHFNVAGKFVQDHKFFGFKTVRKDAITKCLEKCNLSMASKCDIVAREERFTCKFYPKSKLNQAKLELAGWIPLKRDGYCARQMISSLINEQCAHLHGRDKMAEVIFFTL
jgi:hypothetical protein